MNYLIAFSGGLDSTVLLHYFHQHYAQNNRIRAVHIHHGLNPQADEWTLHCQKICENLNIPFEAIHVEIPRNAQKGIEAAARQARYAAFLSVMSEDEILVTAHHQNDQAETFLYHALRGSGPKGLAAMPEWKKFGPGWHWRPFLQKNRHELEIFASEYKLNWIEDDSNHNLHFDRNYLRHEILPRLQSRWPSVTENFARNAEIQAELSEFLDSFLKDLWQQLPQEIDSLNLKPHVYRNGEKILPLSLLGKLAKPLQHWFLRDWIKANTGMTLSKKQLKQIFSEVIEAKQDKQPQLKLACFTLRRFIHALWLVPKTCDISHEKVLENVSKQLSLPLNTLEIRPRGGSERFHPQGRAHSQYLKKLFNEWKIPPWQRSQLPLVYYKEKLIAIGDLAFTQL
ncbi:MAG: tilS [Gammaproteobacteria bacterium]|jgi:tRNA(Ile)-lysidine synthase|nr:tilS [Gammaproteobacteria bacterium]